MKLRRRELLRLGGAAAIGVALPRAASASDYPNRPVRVLVGYPAGGAADTAARLIAQRLSQRLGQQFIVDNRPGANTSVATEAVVQAAPDGYTLLMVTTSNATNPGMYRHLNYDFLHDIAPIAGVIRVGQVMEVNPAVPAQDRAGVHCLREGESREDQHGVGRHRLDAAPCRRTFQDDGRCRSGPRAVSRRRSRADRHGGRARPGHVRPDLGVDRLHQIRQAARARRHRRDALAGAADLPTIADFVPGYEATSFQGLGAPKNTPQDIIDKLNRETNAAVADAIFEARLADLGGVGIKGSPAEFAKLIAAETDKWSKVIKFAGITPQ